MHDWSFLSLLVSWRSGELEIGLQSPSGPASVCAQGLRDLRLPRERSWGPSVSVNAVRGPSVRPDGLSQLSIEMQTGDVIEIVAEAFSMPTSVPGSKDES
jgi:hypothetical protein